MRGSNVKACQSDSITSARAQAAVLMLLLHKRHGISINSKSRRLLQKQMPRAAVLTLLLLTAQCAPHLVTAPLSCPAKQVVSSCKHPSSTGACRGHVHWGMPDAS